LIYIGFKNASSGLRPAPGSGSGERIHKQREDIGYYCQTGLSPQSARILRSPRKHAVAGKKKPTPRGWLLTVWWWCADAGSNSLIQHLSHAAGVWPCFWQFSTHLMKYERPTPLLVNKRLSEIVCTH